MREVIHTTASSNRIKEELRKLPAMMSGRLRDEYGLAQGFKMRLGWAFASSIVEAYIQRGRGRSDEAGETWQGLSKKYLAYQRPMETSKGRGSRKPPRGGKWSPGNKDGLLNKTHEKLWKRTYASILTRLLLMEISEEKAKAIAAGAAWNKVKRAGGQTKLDKFGTRKVQIGVDRGILLGSLTPGTLVESQADANFAMQDSQGTVDTSAGQMVVGTNVDYAAAFHKRRPLWPKPINWPSQWWDDWLDVALGGLRFVAREIAKRSEN